MYTSEKLKKEIVEWKADLSKLWEVISYFTNESLKEYNYVVTAVNGSAILEQKITKSKWKYNYYIKQMQARWGESNVRFDSVRVD